MAKQAPTENSRFIKLCTGSAAECFAELDALPTGLSEKEAEKRLAEFGKNEIASGKKKNFWADMLERFSSPLVVQLLVIALVSAIIGESLSSIIVGVMILLSVGLSYILDQRSNQEVEALGKRVQSRTYVLRDGAETEIKMSEVVPGDIVLLQAGAIVPADVRIISCKDFFVSESALTRESMPVEKSAAVPAGKNMTTLELPNACFMGSSVTSGTAKALVIHTGTKTVFGSLSQKLGEKREETSFDKGIRSFTWLMIRSCSCLSAWYLPL